jgi:hypothetical protein
MPVTQIRGSTQILDGTIPLSKLVSGFSIPTVNLADGTNFLKRDGSVALTATLNAGNHIISSVADPVSAQDAVNLRTLQAGIQGISLRSARGLSVVNQTLSGLPTVDGITYTAGQTILITGNTTASQNGPWNVAVGSWTRPSTWAAASSQKSTMFFVEEGTVYKDTKWIIITDNIVVDTTAVTITQDQSGISYTNGNGLSLVGNAFAIKIGNTIEFNGSQEIQVKINGSSLNASASGLKISDGTGIGQVMLTNALNIPSLQTITGDVSFNGSGVTTISTNSTTGFIKYSNLITSETPTGVINGVNVAFALVNTPVTGQTSVFQNGILLEAGAGNDYTISGSNITMLSPPLSGDKIRVTYVK